MTTQMTAKIDGRYIDIEWAEGEDTKNLIIRPETVVKNFRESFVPAFERLDKDIVLIDGKYYRHMDDSEAVMFIFQTPEGVEMDELRSGIAESNAMLRSMSEITKREGNFTEWGSFRKKLETLLYKQFELMKKYHIKPT